MSHEKIHAAIDALRAEISKLDVDDSVSRERLDRLVGELQQQIDAGDDASPVVLEGSVTELIEQFEVEHPRITGVLNDLMVTLSGMGI